MLIKNIYIISLIYLTIMAQPFLDYRTLLIFGEEDNNVAVSKQTQLLHQNMEGVIERSLKIILVKNESNLWVKYKIPAGSFALLLIGKDGTEKFRSDQPVTTEKIFAIIDAMPMRKAEIKNKGNKTDF